jgi:hypothetical protein
MVFKLYNIFITTLKAKVLFTQVLYYTILHCIFSLITLEHFLLVWTHPKKFFTNI